MAGASDYIISPEDAAGVNVVSQPDVLRGTAAENKQAFDNYSNLIKDRFNSLCSYVDTNTSSEVANSVKALYLTLGWTPDE